MKRRFSSAEAGATPHAAATAIAIAMTGSTALLKARNRLIFIAVAYHCAVTARCGSVGVFARQDLGQALLEQRDRFIHITLIDDQRWHEAHGALPTRQQDEAVVIGAGAQGIAELLRRLLGRPILHQFH